MGPFRRSAGWRPASAWRDLEAVNERGRPLLDHYRDCWVLPVELRGGPHREPLQPQKARSGSCGTLGSRSRVCCTQTASEVMMIPLPHLVPRARRESQRGHVSNVGTKAELAEVLVCFPKGSVVSGNDRGLRGVECLCDHSFRQLPLVFSPASDRFPADGRLAELRALGVRCGGGGREHVRDLRDLPGEDQVV